MSAKHKRPFYVFAVVAAICSLVLVAGIRGKAESSSPGTETAGSVVSATVNSAGVTIKRLAQAVDARVMDTKFGGFLGGTGDGRGPSSSGGTQAPGDAQPSPNGTDELPDPGPGSGDIEGGQTPTDDGTPGSDDPADDGTLIETRPHGDESQTNVGGEDPDGEEPDGDTEGEDPDGDEETPGPLDETEEPSGEGDGYEGDGEGQDDGQGQGDGQSPDEGAGRDVQDEGVDPEVEQDDDVEPDPDDVPLQDVDQD